MCTLSQFSAVFHRFFMFISIFLPCIPTVFEGMCFFQMVFRIFLTILHITTNHQNHLNHLKPLPAAPTLFYTLLYTHHV